LLVIQHTVSEVGLQLPNFLNVRTLVVPVKSPYKGGGRR